MSKTCITAELNKRFRQVTGIDGSFDILDPANVLILMNHAVTCGIEMCFSHRDDESLRVGEFTCQIDNSFQETLVEAVICELQCSDKDNRNYLAYLEFLSTVGTVTWYTNNKGD